MNIRTSLLALSLLACFALRPLLAQPTPADNAFDGVMKQYLALHAVLITDRFDDSSRKLAAAMNDACSTLQRLVGTGAAAAPVKVMLDRSAELTKANLQQARGLFANLGDGEDAYLKGYYRGTSKYFRFYCDMMKKPWAQTTNKPVLNPFYDASMRNCGRLVP